jgi:hypothetical protein
MGDPSPMLRITIGQDKDKVVEELGDVHQSKRAI